MNGTGTDYSNPPKCLTEEEIALAKLKELMKVWPDTLSLKLLPGSVQVYRKTAPYMSELCFEFKPNTLEGT